MSNNRNYLLEIIRRFVKDRKEYRLLVVSTDDSEYGKSDASVLGWTSFFATDDRDAQQIVEKRIKKGYYKNRYPGKELMFFLDQKVCCLNADGTRNSKGTS